MISDGRQGLCYTYRTPSGYCRDELQYRLSKKDCCCGQHVGQGWGDDCSPCPEYGSGKSHNQSLFFLPIFLLDEHRKLCQRPQIYYPPPAIEDREYNQTTWRERPEQNTKLVGTPVDECMLRPTICGQGKCVDLAEGYDCVCDAGFRKGKSQVCEG